MMAIPAAPAPLVTTLISSIFFPVNFKAFKSAAKVTTAVPCWSSWKIGISQVSFNFSSISKQRGAEISSKLIPPKLPAIRLTVFTISSTSLERTQIGTASTSPKALKSAHFPSITGIPASGPMSPSPSTAVPSVTTATKLERLVNS